MTLEFNKLVQQINKMGLTLANQEKVNRERFDEAIKRLKEHGEVNEALRRRARLASGWRVAIPIDEPPARTFPPPPLPERATIIATDGSQIYPDRHSFALYCLINVGCIVFEQGSGKRPYVESEPQIFYENEDIYEEHQLVEGNLLDLRRDIAEVRKLADWAEKVEDRPILALADGTLLLWVLEGLSQKAKNAKIKEYLTQLDRLYKAKAALAGFINRPHHAEVINLLYLASLPEGQENDPQAWENNRFQGLTDRALFSFLEPGERSALFISPSGVNKSYRESGHEIIFFYVNVGTRDRKVIARMEMPVWAREVSVGGQSLLQIAHAIVRKQCQVPGENPYPYVLTRAHEIAVVSYQEKEELEKMILAELVRNNLFPSWSEKERIKKTISGPKRRHKL